MCELQDFNSSGQYLKFLLFALLGIEFFLKIAKDNLAPEIYVNKMWVETPPQLGYASPPMYKVGLEGGFSANKFPWNFVMFVTMLYSPTFVAF